MANNVVVPPTGSGATSPTVETIDTGSGVQRQVVTVGPRGGAAQDTFPSNLTTNGNFPVGLTIVNPTSTLTRPATTGAYTSGIVASNATAGSIVVPTFTAAVSAGGAGSLLSFLLKTNKTSGMGGLSFACDFWYAAPTFTNGDRGVYAVATGASAWLGSCSFANMIQAGDGAYAQAVPDVVASIDFDLPAGTSIYWSLQATSTTAWTGNASQTFTLTARVQQS